jgi:hypothetical protein
MNQVLDNGSVEDAQIFLALGRSACKQLPEERKSI